MRLLITGERGYIARNLRESLADAHECRTVSVRGPDLPNMAEYDAVIHCAGIVHRKNASPAEYMAVNTDLTLRLGEKAKAQGVRRFVFMSTVAVYGAKDRMGRRRTEITRETAACPKTWYGKSKLAAEEGLKALASPDFAVSVLRLPMVYGEGCPGNYAKLGRLARVLPIFPDADNERSVLHIANLCAFVELILKKNPEDTALPCGFEVFCPQDRKYAGTTEMVRLLAQQNGRRIVFSKTLGKLTRLFPFGAMRKLFGNLTYDMEMSGYFGHEYCVRN